MSEEEKTGKKKGKRSLRHVAMDFLARREHSAFELRQKLEARAGEDDDVEAVIRELQQQGLQSDERFVETYVHHRFNAGVGPLKIRHELRQKGVDEGLTDLQLEHYADEWDAMMRAQRARKYGETIPAEYAARMKQARFLQNRGFSPESVMRLFR